MAVVDPPLRAPHVVSPLIRLTRWTLLFSGFAWGLHRVKVNKKKEEDYQNFIAKMEPIWMENKKRILAQRSRVELLRLASDIGQQPPANFDETYPALEPLQLDPELQPKNALAAFKKGKGAEILAKAEKIQLKPSSN